MITIYILSLIISFIGTSLFIYNEYQNRYDITLGLVLVSLLMVLMPIVNTCVSLNILNKCIEIFTEYIFDMFDSIILIKGKS